MATQAGVTTMETFHEDQIHDAVLDYYGRRLATCSSDRTINIFELPPSDADPSAPQKLIETLRGHTGPIWQLAWAHPKFGTILASASYDGKVIIWREEKGVWSKLMESTVHSGSVNALCWAPHSLGAVLAAASSDGRVSVMEFREDGSWDTRTFPAHAVGVNGVSWGPSLLPGSLVTTTHGASQEEVRRFATAGCDNYVKIWTYNPQNLEWFEEATLAGHSDWVRDVAWAPNTGLPKSYLASSSQDKTVLIWTQSAPGEPWEKKPLKTEKFPDVVWRVSWSLSGGVLAVSCGDDSVTLWKENLRGEWECVSEITN
ncbi:WD40 repeat-like protein [Saitoella complicata NRRL Y-17804]|uniref:WD40 repeat-like protein n=1 Tax=Saitoella complicata (strain BCRC 22490 / CBS 7301 / JCM 7358 / NBRC 10748 / NRRL Y-17804) TaxID=698492 RepID=UPI000867B9D6|nr:WD40 repeat-like protein [Saitoella complicata NRRL Y-17804]ODQ50048.1 WD40 repeat-like protein [Saitoella complicata NRRL Y-17804]